MMRATCTYLLSLLLLCQPSQSKSQECNISKRVIPSGGMLYFIEPVNFYSAGSERLSVGILTDGETFYLRLNSLPTLSREQVKKINGNLKLTLANDTTYELKFFDAHFIGDTTLSLIYTISKEQVDPLAKHRIRNTVINLNEGKTRSYHFSLHIDAIIVQLKCFIEARRKKLFS